MKLLAVDDEPSILELLTAFLEAEDDNEIVTATSGAEALAAIEAAVPPFDCILVDIQMPEMNGIALCENIRALKGYFDVPIIMLTAMSQKSYIERAFSVGATDYVTKPFDFLELRCRLRAAAKMVFELGRASDAVDSARKIILDSGEEPKPRIEDPIALDDVDRLVGYAAFENYVLAMSRAKLLFATVFAVRIADFPEIHRSMSPRGIRGVLKSVAEACAGIAPDSGNLICYRGGGVFLCFKLRKSAFTHAPRVLRVSMPVPYATSFSGSRPEVLAVIGDEVSLVSISKSGVLVALHRAVDLVEPDQLSPDRQVELARVARKLPIESEDQASKARQAYEMVLQDIIQEENGRGGLLRGAGAR